jgi:hypothetical protein
MAAVSYRPRRTLVPPRSIPIVNFLEVAGEVIFGDRESTQQYNKSEE